MCVVYFVTCGLSPFLLATKSGVGICLKFERDKTCIDYISFFSNFSRGGTSASQNWFTVFCFSWGTYIGSCDNFVLLLRWCQSCLSSNCGVLTCKETFKNQFKLGFIEYFESWVNC